MSYDRPEVEAFHKSVFRGKKKEVKPLLSEAVVNGTRSDGITALHIVASTGSARICKVLLSCRATLEARESHGATPLNIACQNNSLGVCRLLLEAGADPNSARNDGVTPIYIASQEGHSKIVQLLLQFKANPNTTRPGSGASPLFVAAQKGRAKVVELLVAAGAPVDTAVDNVTALEAAIRAHHMRCAQVLIGAKAKIVIGLQDQPSEESEAQKWLEKARTSLAEAEEHQEEGHDETHKLVLFKAVNLKKKDLAGLSKKEMKDKYSIAVKAIAKVDKQLVHAREALIKERDETRKELADWKMAFMMASAGFSLPSLPEEEPAKLEEVGAAKNDESDGEHLV